MFKRAVGRGLHSGKCTCHPGCGLVESGEIYWRSIGVPQFNRGAFAFLHIEPPWSFPNTQYQLILLPTSSPLFVVGTNST